MLNLNASINNRWLNGAFGTLIFGLTAGWGYLMAFNTNELSQLQLSQAVTWNDVPTSLLLVLGILLGILVGQRSLRAQLQQKQTSQLRSQRRHEAAEVQAEVASDQVKVLEAKIETLEAALAQQVEANRNRRGLRHSSTAD